MTVGFSSMIKFNKNNIIIRVILHISVAFSIGTD